jgi:hypothetical protein
MRQQTVVHQKAVNRTKYSQYDEQQDNSLLLGANKTHMTAKKFILK